MTPVIHQRITLNQHEYSLQIRHSARVRRIRMTASVDGIKITLPDSLPLSAALDFAHKNTDWLLAQMQRVQREQAKRLPADVLLLRGEPHRLVIAESPDRTTRALIHPAQGKLSVLVPAGRKRQARQYLEAWLRSQARQEIETAVQKWAARMQVFPTRIAIRDQRTRWGSCSSRKTLSFNWRLIMAPPSVLEYVVVHELAHLVEPNHSRAFWQVVEKFIPDVQAPRRWLKNNAQNMRTI